MSHVDITEGYHPCCPLCSIDEEMLVIMKDALTAHVGKESCRGILLTAVPGRAFSAGADIKVMADNK